MSSRYISSPLANTTAPSAGVGLGYGIAIAVGILVLVSTILLASYLCVRAKGGSPDGATHHHQPHSPPPTTSSPPLPATVVTLGLDEPTINSYPKFVYNAGDDPAAEPCPICLSEYRRGDTLRAMPECAHRFHADCVDEWLRVSATCPLCRSSPAPSAAATPLATPLSELIPLALHAR